MAIGVGAITDHAASRVGVHAQFRSDVVRIEIHLFNKHTTEQRPKLGCENKSEARTPQPHTYCAGALPLT